jgi:Tol biopolymer transport system component
MEAPMKQLCSALVLAVGLSACGGAITTSTDEEATGNTSEALACFQTSATTRVSVSSSGAEGNGNSVVPSLSGDGRLVAFDSDATNMVAGDTNAATDVFLRDLVSGLTTRISVGAGGAQGNARSSGPKLSTNGRFASFTSEATNLVSGDTNGFLDIFVRDLNANQTTRVNVSSGGAQANDFSFEPAINQDGRFVAFSTSASNLVNGDTNMQSDVFVRDRQTGQTSRVSVAFNGTQGNGFSASPAISADGRFVAFGSGSNNLVPGGTNGQLQTFVRDRTAGNTVLASVSNGGAQANFGVSNPPSISADGRFVAFSSFSTNLVANDNNLQEDVFLRDRTAGTTIRVSNGLNGEEANGFNAFPTVSPDGRLVAFISDASNLVPGDTNNAVDLFVFDRTNGRITRVDVTSTGGQADNRVILTSSISTDNRLIAFDSVATNLVPNDTNDWADVFTRDLRTTRAWAVGVRFVAGELVTFNGVAFEVLQTHTSQVGWEPPNAASLWRRPTPCGLAPWTTNTSYIIGSRVTFNGATFRAIQAHTSTGGSQPPSTPALWQPSS